MMKKILFFITIFGFSTLLSQSVVSLDGSNDYLTTTETTGTKLEGDFTISGWVFLKGDATQQVFHNELFEIQYQGSYYRQFRIYPGGYSTTWGEASINEWHHIAVTRSSHTNAYDTLYVYVDGKQSLMFARDQSSTTTFDGTMYLGRDPDYGEYFRGFMDEFAIWNTVLDSNSVKELYNGGVPKSATSVKFSNMLSYWKMDDGTGTSATNAVSGSPSLSLQQGATWSTFTKSAKPKLLADIRSGYTGSYPKNPREYNSKLYFVANDGVKGDELWVYNPVDSTTARVTDIASGSNSGLLYESALIEYKGKLYFTGYESNYGAELYSYDGSNVTRVTDINSGWRSSYAKFLSVLNDTLYFVSTTNTYGYEWYSYDGSSVTRRTDIRSGASDGVYIYGKAKVYKDKIYFPGYDSSKGVELYSYDRTNGAQLVKDIYDGSGGSYPSNLTVFNEKLYLTAGYKAAGSAAPDNGMEAAGSESGMSHENKFLKYDGTDLTVIDLGSSAQYVTLFGDSAVFNKKLYFEAYTTANGYELWSYDETDGGQMVADSIYPGSGGSYPYYITTFNNKLYFRATDGTNSGGQGYELWYYDGVGFGRASDIYQGTSSSQPANLFATNDALYFSATNNTYGYELWGIRSADPKPVIASVTSTTSDGTYKVGDAINITVSFSEAVTLSSGGSLTVTLETGTTDRTVSITSISNATSASGTYTVQSGDLSSDLTANSVSVSGSLSDASSQAMDSFTIGSNLASSSALVIDGVLPTIASVKSTSDNATYSADSKINITVNFSEAVSISSSGTLTVTLETGTTDRDVTITDISSTTAVKGTYTVQSGDASDDLDVKSIALSSGATLKDAAGNSMSSLSIHADSSLADFNNIKINTTKPGTPTNLAAKNRYGGIGLKWYKESSAAKYYVYRSGDNATFEKLSTEPTDTTFIDALTAGSKYYYYVTAVNSAGTAGDTSKHVFGYATRIWWVDVTNGKDETRYGVSADSSFKTIEQAVKTNSSLVSGDTIYVKPSISSSKSRDDVGGYYDFGGITGGINLNHSKDFVLKSTAGADSTILNAELKNRHFYFDDGQTAATKIIGFTFYRGKEENAWPGGGSIVISGSNIKFQDCVFDSNRVTDNNNGGAVAITNQAVPTFTGCTFTNNFVTDTDGGGSGGAVYIQSPNSVDDLKAAINFEQCKFIGNFVKARNWARGGAIETQKYLNISNCLFVKNGAIGGFGADANDGPQAQGGAIVISGGYNTTGTIVVVSNSTFDRNYVDVRTKNGNVNSTDIFYGWQNDDQIKKLYLYNTIITGSYRKLNGEDYITTNESDKIFYSYGSSNKANVNYSAIEGSSGQSWADDNVFDIVPVYVDTASLDYSLSIKSPAIGQGTSSYEGYSAPTVDILGNTRPSPSGSNPDMGAYENSLSSSPSPMPVTGLTGTTKTNSAYLSWTAVKASLGSSDNAADIKYLVYQGDSQVASSASTTYTVTGLDNGTTYTFSVAAQDTSSGETGALSKTISVTPKYRGPKWYVAYTGGDGSPLADTLTNADLGSIGSRINHLTSAIEIASAGDTIIMQKGTHTGSNNRGIDWNASKSLVIMGDPNYTAENIIIDAGGRDRHFEFDSGEDNTYQVIGLTLYNGKSTDQGGGSVSIGNYSNPVFKKVIFKGNVDESSNWRGGGAVNIGNYSTPSFYYCTFDGNVVDRTGTDANSEAYGGAVFVYSSPANMSVLFEGCIFKNNMAKGNQSATGGALGTRDAQVDILNCLFYGNTAYASVDGTNNNGASGGAITVTAPGYYSGSQKNWVGGYVKIINSTIVNNLVKSGSGDNNSNAPGVYLDSWSRNEKAWFFNNIVWGNKTDYGTYNYQVFLSNESGWGGKYLNYNVIQNSSDISSLQDDNSFETDPTFVDTANGDYSLSNASQLIGKGGSSYEGVSAPTADILGLSRPNPSGSNPDIGAYENGLSKTPYPPPVENLTAIGGSQSVTLLWDAVAGADSVYKVYQHTEPPSATNDFIIAAAYFVDTTSSTTYTISGLDNATRYYFRVSAVNTKGYEGTASSSIDITPKYSGPVWWLSSTGSDDNEGSSGSPFGTIAHALEHVTAGDTVMLKSGTYTGSGNREIEISSNNSTANFDNYKNLVITSEKGADSTIIDAGNNGRHFTIVGNQTNTIDSTLQFIGLTFTGGKRSDWGGSVYISAERNWDNNVQMDRGSQMQPKFKDCVFKDNQAISNNGGRGGAIYLEYATPIFESCVFDSNYANAEGGALSIGGGTGVYIDTVWVSKSTFKNNWVDDDNTSNKIQTYGGAINLQHGMYIIIANSTFENNMVISKNSDYGSFGGAISIDTIWDEQSQPLLHIANSRFTKNKNRSEFGSNAKGGAIYAGAPFALYNTLIDSNTAESSSQNGRGMGGGLFVDIGTFWDQNGNQIQGNSYLINNTIVDNYVSAQGNDNGESGGVHIEHGNETFGTWWNNIFWGNRSDAPETNRHNLSTHDPNTFNIVADYNDVEFSENYGYIMGSNSYDLNPAFYSATNYQLSTGSSLIGAGKTEFNGITGPTTDIIGNARPNPAGSNPDLGAYENSLAESPYPKQVKNLVGVSGSRQVTLLWDAVAGADSVYKVYQHTEPPSATNDFIIAAAYFVDTTSSTTYTISGLDNATRYYFRVSAVNTKGYEGTASSSIDITPKYSGPVWWLSSTGSDDNEGSSGSPFGTIAHALEHVTAGDTVMLKSGTYTGSGNREIEISSNNSTANFDNYKNLVITSEKGADSTIIDAGNNGRHFTIVGNQTNTIDSTLQFIGLTFTGGRSSDNGGSFNIQAENYYDSGTNKSRATLMQPKFKDCIFKDNRADGGNNGSLGGAFHISDGAPIFENCVFDSNYSNNGGGAINITGNEKNHRNTLWFRDCTFKNNRADDAGLSSQGGGGNTNWGVRGGAVWLGFGMDVSFINCVFENNEAVESNRNDGVYGGALSISQQWAHEVDPMVRIYNSRFTNNVARQEASGGAQSHGGAIYAGAPFTMVNSLVDSNRAEFDVTNGTGRGGGLFINVQSQWDQSGNEIFGSTFLTNNTIVDNYANGGSGAPYSGEGGGIFLDGSNQQRGVWFNNIIWGNRTANTTDTFWHNMNPVNSDQFKLDTDYNDLEFSEHYPYFMGSNSYDVDPAFYSATNYQLSTGSPLIGAGATSFNGSSAPLVDILGNVRPNPSGSNPDLGAYENSLAESPYPKQVKNLVGVFGSRQVSLSWDANTETDIKKYLVYMSTTVDFEPTPADSVDETTATSYTVTGLTNKTEYHFRVAAVDSSGYRGAYSDTVSVTPEYLGPNWWVSVQNGSDDTGDGSIEFPFSSIHQAFYETSHADTIRIMPGTYYEHSFSNYDPQSTQPQSTGRFDLTIVGMNSTGEVIVDAQKNNRHMMINGGFTPDMQISMTFRNIHFTNGEGRDEDGFNGGGSMYLAKITAKFVNCHFSNNQATAGVGGWTPGGALNIYSSTVKIISCTFEDNFSRIRGGAINIDWYDENDEVDVEIRNSTFTRNDVQINDGEQMSAWGGAIYFGASRNLRLKIEDSIFSDNRVRNNNSGQGCGGGVIGSMSKDPNDDWSNIEPVIIDRNIFMDNGCDCGPGTWAGGSVIDVGWNIDISNSLFAQNYTQNDGGIYGFVIRNGPQDLAGAEMTMVNNTIVRNQLRNQNGSVNTDGSPISAFGGSEVTIFNNIIWDNESNQVFSFSDDVTINEDYNNIEDNSGQQFGANTLLEEPRFADPENDNYRLGATSPLIDKGTQSFMGHNAPIKDVRGYYRIGTPDIGAYEAGASKYILTLIDDIEENKDTTFVNLSQELKVTVTTGDIDGNVVTDSDEPVSWDIFPNQKYARVGTDAETTTSNGTASATIIVTSQTKGKGFRFRVNVYVGEGFEKSDIYVIEEIVTGAPPPVVDLTISPSTWTSQPDFTLNWETPTWSAQRELIGAVVEITDGINVFPDYLEFPPGDSLTNYSFTAPEAGQYDVSLWLTGELGNEERDSARNVTAYFDNIQPSEFNIHWPNEGSWVSDKPQFRWEISGDYPSGIKTYHLFLNEQHYAAFDPGQVNYDNPNDEVYIVAPTSIPDGYHSWHAEIWDLAENITWSNDTINFGVDITPPNISHPSPLGTIDEGATTPTINVNITDGASGVKYANLHYRRSGSGSGFVTVDLMSGPVSISGNDVKEDGLEYWIDAEDNVGNYDAWPGIGEFHSVSVRSEGSINTADNWSNGVPGGTDSTNYLFFSIPFEVGNAKNAITSIMGPPDEFNYRLFSYNNGWQEDPPSVTMGNAYFFIFDPDKYAVDGTPTKIEFNFGQGTSTPTDPPYGIGVSSGQWKFFGSPYNYGVSLDNVYTEDEENIRDAGSIYTWSGSWSSAGSSLQPWKGYIFKSGGATNLNIDARGSGFGKMAKAMNTDDYPMDADEWIIDMIATTGYARDELNAVGVRSFASDGYDPLDEFEPPAVMGDITLRIDNRDREESPELYAKDIRKPNEAGHYWDLQVFAPTNGQRTYLTFDGLGYIPEEYDIFLINKTTKQAKNLEWESSYRFANTGSEDYLKQEFRLVVGTKDFVQENNAGVELYPDAFTLSQNYPNPFNPQTSIMISLEEDAQLNLIIYNLLGEEVTRLAMNEHRPAGYYTFIWNGTNAMGSKVSTGVYFYHAMIRDAQGKVVLNKTRKMIFLK